MLWLPRNTLAPYRLPLRVWLTIADESGMPDNCAYPANSRRDPWAWGLMDIMHGDTGDACGGKWCPWRSVGLSRLARFLGQLPGIEVRGAAP